MRKLILTFFILILLSGSAFSGKGLIRLPWVEVPTFTLPDLDGKQRTLEEFRGKPLVVNFWASWCAACLTEMPSMNRAWEILQQEGIQLIAINVGEDKQTVQEFAQQLEIKFPVLLDEQHKVSDGWPVRGLPMTFILDADGKLVYRALGGREWDDPFLLAKIMMLNNSDNPFHTPEQAP